MYTRTISFFALTIFVLLLSCSQKEKDNYFIFGHSFGLCGGEQCVETFQIKDDNLFEDTKDSYGNKGPYDWVKLSQSEFEMVKDLQTMVPEELKDEDDVIGCPDCYDQGGVYIEIVKNGEKSAWLMDMDSKNLPDYLHSFKDSVALAIVSLQ